MNYQNSPLKYLMPALFLLLGASTYAEVGGVALTRHAIQINGTVEGSVQQLTGESATLNGNVGQYAVPPGTYGDFTANGGSGFTLGVVGATQPSVYNFQHLTLNGQTQFNVVGPVVITVANGFTANGTLGASSTSSWLI